MIVPEKLWDYVANLSLMANKKNSSFELWMSKT